MAKTVKNKVEDDKNKKKTKEDEDENETYGNVFFYIDFIRKFQGCRSGFTYDMILDYYKENGRDAVRRTAERFVQALRNHFISEFDEEWASGRKNKIFKLKAKTLLSRYSFSLDKLNAFNMALKIVQKNGAEFQSTNLNEVIREIIREIGVEENVSNQSEDLKEAFDIINLPRLNEVINDKVLKNLQEAILERKNVVLVYQDNTKEEDVFPFGFIQCDGSLYLVSARSQGKKGKSNLLIKYIKVSEIYKVNFVKINGNENFAREESVTIKELADHSFGISSEKPMNFKIHFNANVAQTAMKYTFQADQQVVKNEDGSCDIQFTGAGVLDLSWFLCRFGKSVRVLEPANFYELAEQAQQDFENNGCQCVTASWIKEYV